jgi:hypothetical protein
MTEISKQKSKQMIVTQSNELTEAAYYLPLQGKRVLWLCLADIPPFAEEHDGSFLVSVDSYSKTFGVTIETASNHVKEGASQLISPVWFADKDDPSLDEEGVPWLYKVASRKKRGYWQLQFHPDILPYVLGLKRKYTSFNILNCGAFKNTRQIRLYESLSQYKSSGYWTVEPEWLADKFKLPKSQRNNAGELKRRFLEPALKVINANTPIEADYKAIVVKGTVKRYEFFIRVKETADVTSLNPPIDIDHDSGTELPLAAELDQHTPEDTAPYDITKALKTYYEIIEGKTPPKEAVLGIFPFIDELASLKLDVQGEFGERLKAVIKFYTGSDTEEDIESSAT